MPFYDYRCTEGHEFEVRQSMSEDPLTKCQECGAPAARVLSAPAIHFKGTGFHNTDYASKRRSGGDGEGSSSNGSSEGGSSDNGAAASSDNGSSKPAESSSSKKTVGLDKI